MVDTASVSIAAPAEAARCVEVLTRAFSADPPTRWVWPDPQQYRDVFPRFVQAFGGAAFTAGTAHHVADSGVALWLPPGAGADDEALAALMEETVPPERRDVTFAVFEQMGAYHPHEEHWYLPLIGVDPDVQGKGIGSALLEHALKQCDAQGLPAYLEASTPGSVRLYRRHGFEPLAAIQVGDSPAIVPMLRPPGAGPLQATAVRREALALASPS